MPSKPKPQIEIKIESQTKTQEERIEKKSHKNVDVSGSENSSKSVNELTEE